MYAEELERVAGSKVVLPNAEQDGGCLIWTQRFMIQLRHSGQ